MELMEYTIKYESPFAMYKRSACIICTVVNICIAIVLYTIGGYALIYPLSLSIIGMIGLIVYRPRIKKVYSEDSCYTTATNLIKNEYNVLNCDVHYVSIRGC